MTSPSPFSDELLARLKARDARAQRQLHDLLFLRVRAVCARMLRDPTLAADAANDLWMDFVWVHVDKVRSGRALPSYLRMMTVRACFRLRDQRARHHGLEAGPQHEHDAVPADEALAAKEDARRLERCLERLPQRTRDLLRLRYEHELEQKAIGDMMSVSKQYIGRVLNQALQRLRKCLEARS